MNNFLQFYGANNISPVSQDISNFQRHVDRREGLYRSLGLPRSSFVGKEVLEAGPGSGYNSIVTATFGMASYDLVEPNPAGFAKLVSLFDEHGLKSGAFCHHNIPLEDLPDRKYDIVLCEGLLPGLSKFESFLATLAHKVKPNGVLVVTCADAVSALFESLRRYLARVLASRYEAPPEPKQFVALLSKAFASHLSTLAGISRPVEDWVWDNLLNPAAASHPSTNEFSVETCLRLLGDHFYFYGSSPIFMSNWSWYKELPVDPAKYNQAFHQSFKCQRQNFLHYQEIAPPDEEVGEKIYAACRLLSREVEILPPLSNRALDPAGVDRTLAAVRQLKQLATGCGLTMSAAALKEFIELFGHERPFTERDIAEMGVFRHAFGRGQQYLSLVRA